MDLMRNVPGVAWVCLTVAFLAVVGAFVVLDVTGTDGTEFRGFLNIVANLAGIVLGGGGLIYSSAAQRSAAQAARQTNGDLDGRIQAAVSEALAAQRAVDVAPGGEYRR